MYLVVSTEAPVGTWTKCTWDEHAEYPTILYAESDSGGEIFESSAGTVYKRNMKTMKLV